MTGTRVLLHDLAFLEEGDEVVIGRRDIDSYGVFPRDGAALVRELSAGRTTQDAARWYEDTYGEAVDVDELLSTLGELEFVRSADADPTPARAPKWQRLGRALFSQWAWAAYAALVLGAVALMVSRPDLVPSRDDVFFSRYLVVVELAIVFGQFPLGVVHELFHVLAGRRLGLHSRVRMSQRLHFVVFETVLDGLVAVPRPKRFLPILAGMLADVVGAAVLVLVAGATSGTVRGLCLALAFTTLPRVAWQFHFFLRTDLYFLLSTLLGCVDLHGATRAVIRNRFWWLAGRLDRIEHESAWHPRDLRAARWYSYVVAGGYAVSLTILATVMLPIAYQFFSSAFARVTSGPAGGAAFWDALVLLSLNAFQLLLAGALWLRDRRSDSERNSS